MTAESPRALNAVLHLKTPVVPLANGSLVAAAVADGYFPSVARRCAPPKMSRRAGFTLLELCLALAIALIVMSLSVPYIDSIFSEQELMETFEEFDDLVQRAHMLSLQERRDYVILFEEEGVALEPFVPGDDDPADAAIRIPYAEGASLSLARPVALAKDPPMEWVFWRSGNCEPVAVSFEGPLGRWVATYDPLTVRGTLVEQAVK